MKALSLLPCEPSQIDSFLAQPTQGVLDTLRHLGRMIDWIAAWIETGGDTLGKPTHFEVWDGKF